MSEVRLESGWLRKDTKRATEQIREWATANDERMIRDAEQQEHPLVRAIKESEALADELGVTQVTDVMRGKQGEGS